MKCEFIRNKRITEDSIAPLTIKIEKRVTKRNTGIMQALINVLVYVIIFLVFFKNNLQFMGLFIAFMVASVITQVIIRIGSSIKKSKRFPFFRIVKDLKVYKDYLKKVESEIDKYIDRYNQFLLSNLFPTSKLYGFVMNLSPQLFCRLPMHNDFLTLNLGQSFIRYPISISYPTFTYNEDDNTLSKFKYDIEKKILKSEFSLPFAFSLKDKKSIAIANKGMLEDEFIQIINAFILDIAVLQSSEEVTLCFVFNMDYNLEWVRFLPHVWSGGRRLIFCATEPETEFNKLLNGAIANKSKHMVAFIDADFAQSYRFYNVFNNDSLPDNLSVVFFSQVGVVPSRMTYHIDCTKKSGKFLGSYESNDIILNTFTEEKSIDIAKKLFNIRLVDNYVTSSHSIPERLTFFELFGVKTAVNILSASIEDNKIIQSHFPVIVGLGNECEEIFIDLTNDGDGNHCLVTGTNGSGKSEFMLTYVLTACLKYRPDYLSFVAIDFKGGAMSSKICNLPHCLGEFTNSNGNISKRELTRIAELLKSEIHYREEIMKEAGCANDLPKYHRLYSEGKVRVALPRLLIVVDEVAVFFAKDNMAVTYITEIATVGRAVGMILLLATQSKNGVIPSQVKTNINVNVEFFSEDDDKKNSERIKGRAIINSHTKKNCHCQVALSAVYDSNLAVVDFITISAKSRMISENERYTQFEQAFDEILRRYPQKMYSELLDEVITEPLELCIKGRLGLPTLQSLYYGDSDNPRVSYPIGISDNVYTRKREAFVYTPSAYNLLVFGKPQSGKTTFIKSVLVSLFNKSYGLRPDILSVYIVAKNPSEYTDYCFPQIGSILPEVDLYYFLLFLVKEVRERSGKTGSKRFLPIVAIIDDCYSSIQQSEELTKMLSYVTNESIKYGISVILSLPFKAGFGNTALKNFSSVIAFHMGDDFEYSSLMHLDSIKQVPDIKGRCLADIVGDSNRTLETQIAYPFVNDESEIGLFAKTYSDIWSGKETPKSIPLMPYTVTMSINVSQRRIPVGRARDLSICSWDLDISNTYLVSYFSDNDAVVFVKYLIDAFIEMQFNIIIVDNQRNSLSEKKDGKNVTYYQYNEQSQLKKFLDGFVGVSSERDTVLIMFDYVRSLFPSLMEEKELIKIIDELIQRHKLYGVFADLKDFLNVSRNSSTRFGQYLEGVNSGILIGNAPSYHTFGFSGLTVNEQIRPLDIGWGINVSPSASEIKRIKIATEVKK